MKRPDAFKVNLGGSDRAWRVIAGLILLVLMKLGHIGAWGYVGLVLLATGMLSFCPLYRLFRLNTCPGKE